MSIINQPVHQPTPRVLLVMGSIRAGRLCPEITRWVAGIGQSCTDLGLEIVDLKDWPLPMDDEPCIPVMGGYIQPHTRAWSEKIKAAAAVVFVTPQYNWGYPASLKNAIDHLYHEWRDKPAAVISYGGHGGGKCTEQLRQVAAALKMAMVATAPALQLPEEVIRHGATLIPEQNFCLHVDAVRQAFAELRVQISMASQP